RGLRRVFKNATGGAKTAVDGLDLTMYRGQVGRQYTSCLPQRSFFCRCAVFRYTGTKVAYVWRSSSHSCSLPCPLFVLAHWTMAVMVDRLRLRKSKGDLP
ncbi:unnamed protein product, partial [Phaeothamnion confervicola]